MDDVIADDEWVLVDTETTGLYPPVYSVEIAAQRFQGFSPVGSSFRVVVNPGVPIPSDATAVHGYTDEYVKKHGVPTVEAYHLLSTYVSKRRVSAHYLRFDWNTVLLPESERVGLSQWAQLGFCTWALARRALPEIPTHRLDVLRDAFRLKGGTAHSAIGDVEATTDLLTRVIFPRLASAGFPTIQDVAYFSQLRPIHLCHLIAQGQNVDAARQSLATLEKRRRQHKKYVADFDCGQISVIDAINHHRLLDENPSVEFSGKCFLFTGTLSMGSRATAQAAVITRGGTLAKSKAVSDAVDYLVIGGQTDLKFWNSSKLSAAVSRLLKGKPNPTLVLEEDFVSALHTHPTKA